MKKASSLGRLKREGMFVYLGLINSCCMAETVTTLKSSYPLLENKRSIQSRMRLTHPGEDCAGSSWVRGVTRLMEDTAEGTEF